MPLWCAYPLTRYTGCTHHRAAEVCPVLSSKLAVPVTCCTHVAEQICTSYTSFGNCLPVCQNSCGTPTFCFLECHWMHKSTQTTSFCFNHASDRLGSFTTSFSFFFSCTKWWLSHLAIDSHILPLPMWFVVVAVLHVFHIGSVEDCLRWVIWYRMLPLRINKSTHKKAGSKPRTGMTD